MSEKAAAAKAGGVGSARGRELTLLLLGGAAGAALVLLATRQELARVIVTPPRPLPVTIIPMNWQDLLPAVTALAVAALASMAAVLATRGPLRRLTGLVAAALGIGIAVMAAGRVSPAGVLTAARHASISSGVTGGTAPGSTTAGTDTGSAGALTGFPAHVVFSGSAWRAFMLIGAVLIVLAGLAIVIRAPRLPVMSARYERGARAQRPSAPGPSTRTKGAAPGRAGGRPDAASMWESLTAGADPTARPDDDG
ncbi:MAG TPA: Trp biosynthesis-associated membrane protein [Streptosporangiaceae bacterium]|nr:Trp biosynthesis-associated membrane protein [Streptosporangiaceae bacterium]